MDASDAAACALRAIAATSRRFGITTWIDLLRGAKNERLLHGALAASAEYGALADWDREQLRALFSLLLADGFLTRTQDDRPVISLTDAGRDFLAHPAPLMLHRPESRTHSTHPATANRKRAPHRGRWTPPFWPGSRSCGSRWQSAPACGLCHLHRCDTAKHLRHDAKERSGVFAGARGRKGKMRAVCRRLFWRCSLPTKAKICNNAQKGSDSKYYGIAPPFCAYSCA